MGEPRPLLPTSRLLAGQVQVVAYADGDVRICPDYAIALDLGPARPPNCRNDLRAVGVRVDALPSHSTKPRERWGYVYLVGRYRGGTFWVTSQRRSAPKTPGRHPFLATPPCAPPTGGWRLVAPTPAQRDAITAYQRQHRGDITSVAYFHDDTIPTVAATHPKRVRALLGGVWPHQLCVVRSRYLHALINRVRARMVRLLESRSTAARYGWISGAGGLSCSERGQPTTPLEVLIETPRLRALLRQTPPGLVVADATFKPVPPL